ncbi:hypothetical protein B0J17DRAFT_170234 [Rhizoctonia solani]|nr:hypothetical protein B0J17DRAFT_170234 [Rhizoctonia solani]
MLMVMHSNQHLLSPAFGTFLLVSLAFTRFLVRFACFSVDLGPLPEHIDGFSSETQTYDPSYAARTLARSVSKQSKIYHVSDHTQDRASKISSLNLAVRIYILYTLLTIICDSLVTPRAARWVHGLMGRSPISCRIHSLAHRCGPGFESSHASRPR